MNNMNTKILFTDLDDTLLKSDKTISKTDLESISKMVNAGHRFVVATGRPFYSTNKLCIEQGFTGDGFFAVCSNGGVIYDYSKHEVILKKTVPFSYIPHLFELASKANLHIHTYTDDYVATPRETEEVKWYTGKIRMPYKVVASIPEDLPYEPPKVIIISLEGRKKLLPFEKSLHPWIDGKLQTVFSSEYLLEILPLEATKGNGVTNLCSKLGIPVENAICCGDEENDISMIEAAGVGVAMNNATESVKAHADYITTHTNNENAITEVINKFILNNN